MPLIGFHRIPITFVIFVNFSQICFLSLCLIFWVYISSTATLCHYFNAISQFCDSLNMRLVWKCPICSTSQFWSLSRLGCFSSVDNNTALHGRPTRAQIPHGHHWREREDPGHDQNLRDTGKENLQERAAGTAGGGGGKEEGLRWVRAVTGTVNVTIMSH